MDDQSTPAYEQAAWRSHDAANRAVAVLGVLAVAANIDLRQGITVGLVTTCALLPVWARHAWRVVAFRWLSAATAFAAVCGLWLTRLAAQDHAVSATITVKNSLLLLSVPVCVGFLIWARRHLSGPLVALLFGAAMLASVRTGGAFAENPWKFGFATPMTIVVLAGAWWVGSRLLQAAAALALGTVSAFNDGRSAFAILFVVAVVLLWEARPSGGRRRAATIRAAGLAAGLAIGAYALIQALILEGAFGEATQARTAAQVDTSGTAIVGGRPEIGAFHALFVYRPMGFGSGSILSSSDILVAKTGMAATGYQPNNGYVENYLFGGQIELHSLTGDLWAWTGIAGLLLAVCLALIVGSGTARTIGLSASAGVLLFLAFRFFWDFTFSPFISSMMGIILLLALGLSDEWTGTTKQPVGMGSTIAQEPLVRHESAVLARERRQD